MEAAGDFGRHGAALLERRVHGRLQSRAGWWESVTVLQEAQGGVTCTFDRLEEVGGVAQEAPLHWSTEQRTAERYKWRNTTATST